MKKYYAIANQYGSDTSRGFANTSYVLVFASRSYRDQYVKNSESMAVEAIRKAEVTKWVSRAPTHFSGERYIIASSINQQLDGCIGEVTVGTEDHPCFVDYFRRN